jgi:hypothetical protein
LELRNWNLYDLAPFDLLEVEWKQGMLAGAAGCSALVSFYL